MTDDPLAADDDTPTAQPVGDPIAPMARPQFEVHLDVFDGPFDLLLGLIAKHKLDVTEIALSKVTDDFIAYINTFGSEWDLEQTTHFLVVAATLLDLKAARLLPQADIDDEEDLALLEARDLLFARLMQYRAYKQVAADFAGRIAEVSRMYPRSVTLEPRFADVLPEVVVAVGPDELAKMAAQALRPKIPETVGVDHIHYPKVSVREQAAILVDWLREHRQSTFRTLTSDCTAPVEVIARFLALLELFRESVVSFEQVTPLGELTIRWTGADDGAVDVDDEFDNPPPPDSEAGSAAGPGAEAGADVSESTEPRGDRAEENVDPAAEHTEPTTDSIEEAAGDAAGEPIGEATAEDEQ